MTAHKDSNQTAVLDSPWISLSESDLDISNFDYQIPDGLEIELAEAPKYCTHAARDHYGYIWFENGGFVEEVWRYNQPIAKVGPEPTLRELMDAVNDEYGSG